MSHPYHHALSSVKKWGGVVEDYLPIHNWFDASKSHLADYRHRALRHHAQGIFWAEEVFGTTITIQGGRVIPVRWIGEQHVMEDCGRIPTLADWLGQIRGAAWMWHGVDKSVGRLEAGVVPTAPVPPGEKGEVPCVP